MVRKYRRKKLLKVEPRVEGGIELVRCDEYLLLWRPAARVVRRGVTKELERPTPQRWANLVLFLFDVEKRKRSYQLAWNGERLAVSAEAVALAEREPEILDDLLERLPRLDRVVCVAQRVERRLARAAERGV